MKKQIRSNIFETNSSSSHSLSCYSISSFKPEYINIDSFLDENGEIIITGGEYGWCGPNIKTCKDKINYLWTYNQYKENPLTKEEFTNFLKSIFPSLVNVNYKDYDQYYENGYIDHQSFNLLDKEHITSKEFLINPYFIEIDNDNH